MHGDFLFRALFLFMALTDFQVFVKGNDAPDESTNRAATLAQLTKTVESYSLFIGDKQPESLKLVTPPVLHYSDQISPVTDGLVFAWTKNGRPEAIMALHPGTQGNTWIEFRSLSLSPLAATRLGITEWRPRNAGIDFQAFEDAAAPDTTVAKRLTQMRSMLRDLSASVLDSAKGRQELRLLTQPLFRYSRPEQGILDGAIFAFVLSTNPELLLVVEAQVINDKPQWLYSVARFTGRKTELQLKNRTIWPVTELPSTRDSSAPFYQLRALITDP